MLTFAQFDGENIKNVFREFWRNFLVILKTVFAVRNQKKSGMCLPCQELFKPEVKNLNSVNTGFLKTSHKTDDNTRVALTAISADLS